MPSSEPFADNRHAALASGRAPDVRLNLLGGFHLLIDGRDTRVPDSTQRLYVFLALRERPQARLVIAGNLWPDKSDNRASANLRSALWRARTPNGTPLIESRGQLLALSPLLGVDVRDMETSGWMLVDNHEGAALTRSSRADLLEELLPGWYDDWVIIERERIGQIRLHFLEAFVKGLLAQHRHADALDTALRLVAADPLRERSYAVLSSVYQAEGSLVRAQQCRARSVRASLPEEVGSI